MMVILSVFVSPMVKLLSLVNLDRKNICFGESDDKHIGFGWFDGKIYGLIGFVDSCCKKNGLI